jgi:hypothetical protein
VPQRKIPQPVISPQEMRQLQQGLRTRVQLKATMQPVLVPRVKPLRQQSRPLLLALLIRGRVQQFLLRLRQLLRQVPRHLNRN